MAKFGKLSPKNWGSFMPAQNPLSQKGPWYYRKTEMVMVQFETDIDVVAALIPEGMGFVTPGMLKPVNASKHDP